MPARIGASTRQTIGVEVDEGVENLVGGRIGAGLVGQLLGEQRGPDAIAVALQRALAVEVTS